MATTPTVNDWVWFKPSPRANADVKAKITRIEGQFFVTVDADGKQRKIRPAACRPD
jgi:hypothetical protein